MMTATSRGYKAFTIPKRKVEEINHAETGKQLASLRNRMHISRRLLARQMDVSNTYIMLLERGERYWTEELVSQYLNALNEAKYGE